MRESSRQVTKNQAIAEMGISMSNLDRMIRDKRVTVVREDRCVYVLLGGPQPVTDRQRLDARPEGTR